MIKTIYLHHIITKNDIKPDFDKQRLIREIIFLY